MSLRIMLLFVAGLLFAAGMTAAVRSASLGPAPAPPAPALPAPARAAAEPPEEAPEKPPEKSPTVDHSGHGGMDHSGHEGMDHSGHAKPKVPEEPAGGSVLDLKNPKCPVMGGETDGTAYTVHEGVRVHFCCPGCEEDFLKDPGAALKTIGIDDLEAWKREQAGKGS